MVASCAVISDLPPPSSSTGHTLTSYLRGRVREVEGAQLYESTHRDPAHVASLGNSPAAATAGFGFSSRKESINEGGERARSRERANGLKGSNMGD